MQSTRNLNIGRSGMSRRIAQQVDNRGGQIILGTQPLQRRGHPHLLSLALALRLPDLAGHLRVDKAR